MTSFRISCVFLNFLSRVTQLHLSFFELYHIFLKNFNTNTIKRLS